MLLQTDKGVVDVAHAGKGTIDFAQAGESAVDADAWRGGGGGGGGAVRKVVWLYGDCFNSLLSSMVLELMFYRLVKWLLLLHRQVK